MTDSTWEVGKKLIAPTRGEELTTLEQAYQVSTMEVKKEPHIIEEDLHLVLDIFRFLITSKLYETSECFSTYHS